MSLEHPLATRLHEMERRLGEVEQQRDDYMAADARNQEALRLHRPALPLVVPRCITCRDSEFPLRDETDPDRYLIEL